MSKTIYCTIAAANYLPRVQILRDSLRAHGHSDFRVLLIEHPTVVARLRTELPDFKILDPEEVGCPHWLHMAFYYDVMEFSTALKPALIRKLMPEGNVVYLDPDIEVHRYSNPLSGDVRFLSTEEKASVANIDEWQDSGPVATAAGLDATQAEALGLARATAQAQVYMQQAAAQPGAVTTPSGLVFRNVTVGTGPSPQPVDTVKVNYRGTFMNGSEFDSSYKRNEPTEFQLNRVIKCWTEGVQRMKVGGKAMLVCPSNLAYGDQGRPSIPGGATLVFEIELLEVGGAK